MWISSIETNKYAIIHKDFAFAHTSDYIVFLEYKTIKLKSLHVSHNY